MAKNFKIVGEFRRLETNMNVPPVDNNLQIRTLRSRNIPYDMTDRLTDKLAEDRNLISLRLNSLKTSSKVMTSDIPTQWFINKDETIGNTFGQEHLQIPITTPKTWEVYQTGHIKHVTPTDMTIWFKHEG